MCILWAGLLILRPDLPDAKRLTLFLFGTALAMTLMVEIIVLRGDIGRMNTVFKFYLQAWTLLAVSAASALGYLLPTLKTWIPPIRRTWYIVFAALTLSTALFPLYGGLAKIQNRWQIDPAVRGFPLAYAILLIAAPLAALFIYTWRRRSAWLLDLPPSTKRLYALCAAMLGLLLLAAAWSIASDLRSPQSADHPASIRTLDGMDYMQRNLYDNYGTRLDLAQDYRAIRWLQENVQGSPVIVEAAPAGIQYAWFSRISIYTGLPAVVGWQWHQEQQRAGSPQVAQRGQEVRQFYQTPDPNTALSFLQKYTVQYIILGQTERGFYPGPGIDKFETLNGHLWDAVYRDREMVIYEVKP